MAQADAALEICIIGGHVVGADQVVNASPWAANRSHDIVARAQLSHVRTNRFDLTKTFVANHQKVKARRGGSVFGGVDLFIGAVYAYTQNLDQHSPPIGNLIDSGLVQAGQ